MENLLPPGPFSVRLRGRVPSRPSPREAVPHLPPVQPPGRVGAAEGGPARRRLRPPGGHGATGAGAEARAAPHQADQRAGQERLHAIHRGAHRHRGGGRRGRRRSRGAGRRGRRGDPHHQHQRAHWGGGQLRGGGRGRLRRRGQEGQDQVGVKALRKSKGVVPVLFFNFFLLGLRGVRTDKVRSTEVRLPHPHLHRKPLSSSSLIPGTPKMCK